MKIIFILVMFLVSFGCSKNDQKISVIKEQSQELEMITAYNDAYKALNEGDPYFAAKKFLEAEILYPQSKWAPRSALMAAYSYYLQNYYVESVSTLERYLKTYPNDVDLIYAHYLIAIIHYEQITDEKKDLKPLIDAKNKIEFFLKKYPDTDYAIDLKFKNDLIQNQLAAKELYVAKYYISTQKWVPAINRLKVIVKDYQKTIFIEEALHRLVEIHHYLGLENEAKKYAKILGYNYNSSEWFEQSYKVLNKDYKIKKKPKKEDDDGFFKKIMKKIK